MDEKIQQLTNEQLLDVIVLVEENKIIQAIQYIATHTAFQYDDAQEIVTELNSHKARIATQWITSILCKTYKLFIQKTTTFGSSWLWSFWF